MKNNDIVVILGYNHIKILFKYNNITSHLHRGNTAIFWYYSSLNFRLLLFSYLDTYFWLRMGLLKLICRYLYAQEGRPLINSKYRKTSSLMYSSVYLLGFFNIFDSCYKKQALQMIDCFKSFLQLDLSGLKPENVLSNKVDYFD